MPLESSARIAKPKATYPSNHRPAMQVPKGGSSCATCRHVSRDLKHCASPFYVKWHGNPLLDYPADQFCSDWYEPAKGEL